MGELAFELVPLPGTGRYAGEESLEAQLDRWLRSEPLRDLAARSGWNWPDSESVRDLAHRLADLSADWDFRGRARARAGTHFLERAAMPVERDSDIVVGGNTIDADHVFAAAEALGLVSTRLADAADPTHLVILSGTARANVNRTRFAADLARLPGHGPRQIIGLAAHRELRDAERSTCGELGLAPTDTEWTTVRDALAQAFGLGAPDTVVESSADTGDRSLRFARSASYRWGSTDAVPVRLHVVPSPTASDPGPRPANTEHQLRWWAEHCDDLDSTSRIVLVTTQIYVPYQHLVGLRVLGTKVPGGGVSTVGVDATRAAVETRKFTGSDYLQEVRSALLAARTLADALASERHPVARS